MVRQNARQSRKLLNAYLGTALLFTLFSLSAMGCGGDDGVQDEPQTLTENDFSADASLAAAPDQRMIVDFLEAPDTDRPQIDTGEVGVDVIPYKYERNTSNRICWDDEDQSARDFLTLVDSDGTEVLRVEVNGDCVTTTLSPGEYEMRIHHDGLSADARPVFLQATNEADEISASSTPRGLLAWAGRTLLETMRSASMTSEAMAQSPVMKNVLTLVTTRQCIGCVLIGAGLSYAPLQDVKLNGADLTLANLLGADVSSADLTRATLLRADLTQARAVSTILVDTNMRRARLSAAALIGASLNRADLALADLTGADLSGANLTEAILTDTILTNADLQAATWTDGSLCKAGSVGTCVH